MGKLNKKYLATFVENESEKEVQIGREKLYKKDDAGKTHYYQDEVVLAVAGLDERRQINEQLVIFTKEQAKQLAHTLINAF